MRGTWIVGCGYLGQRVATLARSRGDIVHVSTRDPVKACSLQRQGYSSMLLDLADPTATISVPKVKLVLYSVGFDRTVSYSRADLHVAGLKRLVSALPKTVRCFCFVSSTSVYGDQGGAWVDETAVCRPESDAGRTLLRAEELLRGSWLADRLLIMRLAGLYGTGRIPSAKNGGRSMSRDGKRFVNLIHVDDAAAAIDLGITRARLPNLFNLSDGNPVTCDEFRRYADVIFGKVEQEALPTDTVEKDIYHRRRGNKRISVQHLRDELEFRCRYVDFRAGLAASRAD